MILLHFLIHDSQGIICERTHGSRTNVEQSFVCDKSTISFGSGVSICFFHAGSAPVRACVVADFAFFAEFFHDLDQFSGRNRLIISVIKININIICTKCSKRKFQILTHIFGRNPGSVHIRDRRSHIRMTALGEKDDIVTLSTLSEPLTKDTFAASDLRWNPVRIYTGSIVNSTAHIKKSIKNPESILAIPFDPGIHTSHSHR